MKRIYISAFTSTNFGDDLFVKTLCERYPEHQFYIDCDEPWDISFKSIQNLTILNRGNPKGKWMERFQKYIRKIGFHVNFAYDAHVYIGGSIFIEFQNPLQYHGYFKNLYTTKLDPNIPYFIIGANFGPYQTLDFIEKHKEYFRYQVNDLCMRDRISYELFQDLPQVRYAPDILCTYRLPAAQKKELILISCIYDDGREEMARFDNSAYEKKMIELCEYYLAQGKEICLLSMFHLQQDHVMCHNIKKHFPENVSVVEYTGNIDEITKLFSSAEYVIASRFHAVILGWVAKTPVFPIYYSNKTLNVINDYGFNGAYCSTKDFASLACEQIDANRKLQYIFPIDDLRKEAEKQFSKLDEFIQETSQ